MTIRDMDALYLKQDNKTLCLSHVVLSAIYIYTVSQKKKSQFVRFCGVCCLHCAILMGRCQLGRPVSGTWPICSSSQDSSKKKALARRIIHAMLCFACGRPRHAVCGCCSESHVFCGSTPPGFRLLGLKRSNKSAHPCSAARTIFFRNYSFLLLQQKKYSGNKNNYWTL